MTTATAGLPAGLVKEIDGLVKKKMLKKRRLHELSEDYAYDEIMEGIERGKE